MAQQTNRSRLGAALLLTCSLALSGCSLGVRVADTTTEKLDETEALVRDIRQNYQGRMDRITTEWTCDGMSWRSLWELTGGSQELVDAIMAACAKRYPTGTAGPPPDSAGE